MEGVDVDDQSRCADALRSRVFTMRASQYAALNLYDQNHAPSPDVARFSPKTSSSSNVRRAEPECHAMKSDKLHTQPHDSRLFEQEQAVNARRSSDSARSSKPTPTPPTAARSEIIWKTGRTSLIHLESPSTTAARQVGLKEIPKNDLRYPGLLLQPDSRPISQEQLASEVKSIYAGLTMVETKAIHVERTQAVPSSNYNSTKLASDHWQTLIALHRTLLHEHHDFFLASQQPSAGPAIHRLAVKYTVPAHTWKHEIHSFLELLRQRLPHSLDHMLAFIYLVYQILALLYETVPGFDDSWDECLVDLGRYRIATEDEDTRDRETWASVARSWHLKATDKNPSVGRIYHHLAILTRPNALQQMSYYGRSLCSVEPFPSACESAMKLLDPPIDRDSLPPDLPVDPSFIKAHACAFVREKASSFEASRRDLQDSYLPSSDEVNVFPSVVVENNRDDLLLPEDYPVHGLLWAEESRLDRLINRIRAISSRVESLNFGLMLSVASLPRALAYDPTLPPPELLLRKTEIFDYVLYSLMFPSTGLLWWSGPKTTELSFAMMLLFAVLWIAATNTSSLIEVRTTIFQIWTVFGFNYVARDCIQANQPRIHLLKYTVLSALFAFSGTAVQSAQGDKILKVIPPAVSLAAVILSFITQDFEPSGNRVRRPQDVEEGLPHPDNFDLESLRSDGTAFAPAQSNRQ